MISITFLIPTLDQSGAERQLTLLATNLPKDEYRVHVIALNRGGHFADQLKQNGISVDVLQKRFRFDPLTFVRLRRRLHELNPDIVQSFLFSANSYVRLPLVTPPQTRVIVSERCVDSWKSSWQLQLDRRLVSRTSAMTANSASVAEFNQEQVGIPKSLITVIPNAIDPPDQDSVDRGSLKRELGFSENVRLVGFVGRLAKQKCLQDLIWAFQMLHQIMDDEIALVLIGDGPERDAIAEFAVGMSCRDKVFFMGHRSDAAELLSGLDVFCLPSAFEGMSNSLMEAMSRGVPVVVSDIPANLELINSEKTGLTYPLGSAPELTKAVRRLLTQAELTRSLTAAAAQHIADHHSISQLVEKHEQLYRRLLQ